MRVGKYMRKPNRQGVNKIAKKKTIAFCDKKTKNSKFKQRSRQIELHRMKALSEEQYVANTVTVAALGKQIQLIPRRNKMPNIQAYDKLMSAFSTNCGNIGRSIRVGHGKKCQLKSECAMDNVKNSLDNISNFESTANIFQTSLYAVKKEDDMFSLHMNFELPYEDAENTLRSTSEKVSKSFQWPNLGSLRVEVPIIDKKPMDEMDFALQFRNLPYRLNANILREMGVKAMWKGIDSFSPLQSEFFAILNQYKDLYHLKRIQDQENYFCKVYSVHILNHVLKTRSCILRHNLILRTSKTTKVNDVYPIVPDNYRDQGLSRPKVLVVLPFRKSAFQVVNNLTQLLLDRNIECCKSNGNVINCSRFIEEYSGNTLQFSLNNKKPEDYKQLFSGNIDDNFRIGISVTKKCLKLYTDFNSSDIIITSPLGMRLLVGSSSDNNVDFLNSIEVLIMDQADVFLAQNWENVLLIFDHLHLQPQFVHNIDLKRVRPWSLNGLSRFYRQTIIVASHEISELRSVFNNKCFNYRGKIYISHPTTNGDISNIFVAIPQVFQLIDISSLDLLYDLRFRYFVQEIFPRYKKPQFGHCMIYVPSYFDFVRIRNFFKAESISFAQISEYTKNTKIARARDMFFHSGVHFLIYSERSHFFRRTRIKGIRHLIMYQPPMWAHLYSEMINMMNSNNQNNHDGLEDFMSITVLFSKFDSIRLNGILGNRATSKLINSNKSVNALTIM